MYAINCLKYSRHPLETFFFRTIRPLFSHHTNSLITQNPDGKNGNPASVDKLHGLDGQHGGDDVVRVMLPARHRHEALAGPADKDQTPRAQEAQQTCSGVLALQCFCLRLVDIGPDFEGGVG